jgi:hypothetical protein
MNKTFTYKSLRTFLKDSIEELKEFKDLLESVRENDSMTKAGQRIVSLTGEISATILEWKKIRDELPNKGVCKTGEDEYEYIRISGMVTNKSAEYGSELTKIFGIVAEGTQYESEFKEFADGLDNAVESTNGKY